MTMVPEVVVSRPASKPSSVLLPLPEAPMMATNCPAGISRSMPRRISTRWLPLSRLLVRFRAASIDTPSIMVCRLSMILKYLIIGLLALAPARAQTSRKVLVVFGDSLSAGYGLPAGKSFPDAMQRTLDKEGYAWQVKNLGISGD